MTLAVSVVSSTIGRLHVGVTSDKLIKDKELAEFIPNEIERVESVKSFLEILCPALFDRCIVEVIDDAHGPLDGNECFDALVLSHEVLETGMHLNKMREKRGWKKMDLLCTRRTEPNYMSSTALRRLKKENLLKNV